MFNFRRRSRAEIVAESAEAGFEPVRPRPGVGNLFGLASGSPSPFQRFRHADGVNLFSANNGATTLVVGFGGIRGSLMMGTVAVLEALDSGACDLLLLSDFRRLHFDHGVENYAATLPELMHKVAAIAAQRSYTNVVTYGSSMGGFPALRGGQMLGARRAVSVGGRFAWHPVKVRDGEKAVGAFDPICACRAPFATPCYALYAEGKKDDADHAAMLAAIMPGCVRVPMPYDKHNVAHAIARRNRLPAFFAELFDPDAEPDPARLRALLA